MKDNPPPRPPRPRKSSDKYVDSLQRKQKELLRQVQENRKKARLEAIKLLRERMDLQVAEKKDKLNQSYHVNDYGINIRDYRSGYSMDTDHIHTASRYMPGIKPKVSSPNPVIELLLYPFKQIGRLFKNG